MDCVASAGAVALTPVNYDLEEDHREFDAGLMQRKRLTRSVEAVRPA